MLSFTMIHQSFYRLFAGVDIFLSLFAISAWYILYNQSDDLIILQFEDHTTSPNSFLDKIEAHKTNIHSVGTNGNPQISAEMLRDIYHQIIQTCEKKYLPTSNDNKNELEKELHRVLLFDIILVIVSCGAFVILNSIIVLTTRHSRVKIHKYLALSILLLQLIFGIQYMAAGMELVHDQRFCALEFVLKPMKVTLWIFIVVYKPYQLYVIFKFYRSIANKEFIESPESSSTSFSSITPPTSPNKDDKNEPYDIEKALGIEGLEESIDSFSKSDDKKNENISIEVYRQVNLTNIPQEHEEAQLNRKKESSGSNLTRLLGWGTGKDLRSSKKVAPKK